MSIKNIVIGSKPVPAHNFMVFIGVMPIPFSKVSSIEIGIETEALAEGGENRFVHSLSKPVSTEKTLVLERGVDSGLAGSVLNTAANTALRVGSCFNFIIISVLDQMRTPKKLYVATNAILKKRRVSDLNAMSGEVFIESLEFVYKDLTEVPGVNAMFTTAELGDYGVKAAFSAIGRASGIIGPQERFTKPLDPQPSPRPNSPRFTPPLSMSE